jgi:hypothetical protein
MSVTIETTDGGKNVISLPAIKKWTGVEFMIDEDLETQTLLMDKEFAGPKMSQMIMLDDYVKKMISYSEKYLTNIDTMEKEKEDKAYDGRQQFKWEQVELDYLETMDKTVLFNFTCAVNYVGFKALLQAICKFHGNKIRGNGINEINKYFGAPELNAEEIKKVEEEIEEAERQKALADEEKEKQKEKEKEKDDSEEKKEKDDDEDTEEVDDDDT